MIPDRKKYNFCKDDFEMLGCEFHGVFIPMRTNQDVIIQIIQMNDRFGTVFELYAPPGPGKSFPSSATSFLALKNTRYRRRYNLMRCFRPWRGLRVFPSNLINPEDCFGFSPRFLIVKQPTPSPFISGASRAGLYYFHFFLYS